MSVYECGICKEYKYRDMHGCYEHPISETECICYDCYLEQPENREIGEKPDNE